MAKKTTKKSTKKEIPPVLGRFGSNMTQIQGPNTFLTNTVYRIGDQIDTPKALGTGKAKVVSVSPNNDSGFAYSVKIQKLPTKA